MAASVKIHAGEKVLSKVFSNDYTFVVPEFQRPYSWGIDQAEQLLDDLLYSATTEPTHPYFLGSIVVIKDDSSPVSQIVDGQQRLTTLTILLSVIRDLLPDYKDGITKLIYQKADPIEGIQASYRLALRPRDQEFFRQYIQLENGLSSMPHAVVLSDSQR